MRHWVAGNHVGCQHKDEHYVGSFTFDELALGSTMPRREKLDVYVFPQTAGDTVCIRYGVEGSEYYSPGTLTQFIQTAGRHDNYMYAEALRLILKKGTIKWERKHE